MNRYETERSAQLMQDDKEFRQSLEIMEHCIGIFLPLHLGLKDGIYEVHRNGVSETKEHPIWKKLVEQGYAQENVFRDGSRIYSVTQKGLDWLGEIHNMKIIIKDLW